MSQTVTIQKGQSLQDISLRYYGSLAGIIWLIEDNGLANGLNETLTPGQELILRSIEGLPNSSKTLVQALARANRHFATSSNTVVASGNCYVEDGYVEDGYVSCLTPTAALSLVEYYTDLLNQLGILNDLIVGRNRRITAVYAAGETIFSIYATSDEAATYSSAAGVNIDSYTVYRNEIAISFPFDLEAGDELEIVIVPTNELADAEISITGLY